VFFFFSSRRRHTRSDRDWSSDVCSSDLVRLDPALDALLSSDARLQLVKGGFGFFEGLIWVEQGRYLLLSDIPANVIYKLTPAGRSEERRVGKECRSGWGKEQ